MVTQAPVSRARARSTIMRRSLRSRAISLPASKPHTLGAVPASTMPRMASPRHGPNTSGNWLERNLTQRSQLRNPRRGLRALPDPELSHRYHAEQRCTSKQDGRRRERKPQTESTGQPAASERADRQADQSQQLADRTYPAHELWRDDLLPYRRRQHVPHDRVADVHRQRHRDDDDIRRRGDDRERGRAERERRDDGPAIADPGPDTASDPAPQKTTERGRGQQQAVANRVQAEHPVGVKDEIGERDHVADAGEGADDREREDDLVPPQPGNALLNIGADRVPRTRLAAPNRVGAPEREVAQARDAEREHVDANRCERSDREEEPADRRPDELVQDDLRRRYLGVRLVQVFRGNRLRQDSKGGAVGQRFNESDRREDHVEDRHRHRARQLQYAQYSEDHGLGEVGQVQ